MSPAELLDLADAMLARGVVRFEFRTGLVEFSPSAVAAQEAAQARERADADRARRIEEAGTLQQLEAQEARDARDRDLRLSLGSA